jgi:hypothetical protein
MGKSTTAHLRNKDSQLTVSQHETDAPIIPMAQIAQLKEIHPERVDWVFSEATVEGQFRRAETKRINTYVFIERMAGILAGLAIGLIALLASYHLAMAGHDWVAGIIGGTTVIGLVSAFVIGAKHKPTDRSQRDK